MCLIVQLIMINCLTALDINDSYNDYHEERDLYYSPESYLITSTVILHFYCNTYINNALPLRLKNGRLLSLNFDPP